MAAFLARPHPACGQPATSSAPAATWPASLVVRENDVVLFLGDELIDAQDPRTSTNFPFLVESFLTVRYPELHTRFVYSGWENDTVARVLLRLDRDVLPRHPTLAVVCLGLNDPEYVPFSDERLSAFRRDLTTLVGRLKQAGIRVWLISPPSVREDLGRTARIQRDGQSLSVNLQAIQYNATLAQYASVVQEVAAGNACGFVDWYAESIKARSANFSTTLGRDGRLPSPQGHAMIAAQLLQAWRAEPIRVQFDLNWRSNTAQVICDGRATAVRMEVNEDGRRTLELAHLPMPWPTQGARAGSMNPDWEAAEMCEFILHISDPPVRGVTLQMESKEGGPTIAVTLTAGQLGAGLNLATSDLFGALRPVQELVQQIGSKNYYQYSTWRRQELYPPREPELAAAQQQLVAALNAYARGYEQVIGRMSKRFDARLVLFETIPPERVPTAAALSTRPVQVVTGQPGTRPTTTSSAPY